MPYMSNGKRDYRKQYDNYDGQPAAKKARAKRNAARSMMEQSGKVSKGDGKEVNHKKPLSKGGSNARSNLNVTSRAKNRSFARTASGKVK